MIYDKKRLNYPDQVEIALLMDAVIWFTAQEASAFGLIDRIAGEADAVAPAAPPAAPAADPKILLKKAPWICGTFRCIAMRRVVASRRPVPHSAACADTAATSGSKGP